MAVAEQIGHDHTGRPVYKYNKENNTFLQEIWDDTETIRKELDNPSNSANTNVFVVSKKDIVQEIYVPRYYWNKRIEKILKEGEKKGYEFVQINKLIEEGILSTSSGHGSPPSGFKGKGHIPYIRVADIVNWEVYKNQTALIPENIYKKIKGENGIDLREKDILFVRRGSYRIGSVALLSPFDKEVLLTKEIQVIRVEKEDNKYDIDPYYLLYLFSHELTQQQLYNKIMIDTTLPNIANRWKELYLPIAKDKKEREKIRGKMKSAFEQKWKAHEKILQLKDEFGNLIT